MVTKSPSRLRTPRARPAARRRRTSAGAPAADAAVFAAVADPTRRAILDSLRAGRRAAGQIAADFSVSRPAVSKHLRVLSRARLVRAVRQGRNQFYELQPAPLREIDVWLQAYRTFWAAKLIAIKRLVEDEAGSNQGTTP